MTITRRNVLITAGAALGAGVGIAPATKPRAAPGLWSPIASGQKAKLGGLTFEAECGPNPVAIQQSKSGVVRFAMQRGNGWVKDDPDWSERAELDGWPSALPTTAPIWVAWSMFLEEGPPSTSDWVIFQQVFQIKGQPFVHVMKSNGVMHWVGADANMKPGVWPTRHNQKIQPGVWINVVEVYKFDPVGGNGYWKSWVDGRQVLDFKGALGTKGVEHCYAKFGIYRAVKQTWLGITPNDPVVYVKEALSARFANMRFGTQDLSGLIDKPDPTPLWEPWG